MPDYTTPLSQQDFSKNFKTINPKATDQQISDAFTAFHGKTDVPAVSSPTKENVYTPPVSTFVDHSPGATTTTPSTTFTPRAPSAAENYVANFQAPPTEDQNYAKLLGQSSGILDAINKKYQDTAKIAGGGAAERVNAAGLAGSSAGATITQEALQPLIDQRESDTQAVYKDIRDTAQNLTIQEEQIAQGNAKDTIALMDRNKTIAEDSIKKLANSGATLDQFKTSNPDAYAQLVNAMGGDENLVAANFTLSKPQATVLESKTVGNTFYQVTQDPITKQISTQHFDLGFNVPVDSQHVKVGNDVLIYPKQGLGGKTMEQALADGTVQVFHGTPDAMAQAIKGLTLANKSQDLETKKVREDATKALFATRLIGSQVKQDKRIQNFLSIAPAMGRIEASKNDIAANGVNPANLGDLIEAVTQVNSGGGQITEGKLDLIRQAQSYKSQFDLLAQKVSGAGGVVSANTAKQMIELSQKIYDIYKGEYSKAASQYENRLSNTPLGDLTGYSPLTDITALPDVISGNAERSLSNTVNQPLPTDTGSTDPTTEILTAGGQDNGDGTYTMPDGTVVDPTQ